MSKAKSILVVSFGILFAIGALVACSPQAAATPTAVATEPTPFPTYNYVLPTSPPVFGAMASTAQATAEATTESNAQSTVEVGSELDPQAVERGQTRYEALACGTCHGADAAGTDNGPSLLGPSLDEDAFISFLRTGGTVGSAHLYAANRLSDSGGHNIYQFIRSLSAS